MGGLLKVDSSQRFLKLSLIQSQTRIYGGECTHCVSLPLMTVALRTVCGLGIASAAHSGDQCSL